jgi:hypothetical protein
VALPRLRYLQGKSRKTFGLLLGFRLTTDASLAQGILKSVIDSKEVLHIDD